MENALKDTFGLDIRDTALTAVELRKEKETFKVVNYSRVDLEPGIVDEDSIILNPEAFKEAVLKLLKEGHEGKIDSKNVIISIPEEKTFSHYLKVPPEQAGHRESILQQAKDFIPIELSEAAIDYKRLKNETGKKEIGFDFAAVQKSIVQPLIDTLQETGLRVVAIDVDKNSLMRACSPYKIDKTSSMLIQINHERSLLSVRNTCGVSHTLTLNIGEKSLLEKIKEDLKIESAAQVKTMVKGLNKTASGANETSQKVQNHLKVFFETLIQKAQELYKMAQDEECPEIDNIFIVEMGMEWPGLKEALKKAFPKANISNQLECVRVGEEDQRLYFNAVGLALRAVLPQVHEQEINLLPHTKKEEFQASKLRPKLRFSFLFVFLAIAGLTVFVGMSVAQIYFDYLVSEKELSISLEKINDPYLTQVAQTTQQKTQLENQINVILKDNLPASWVIEKIDSYNVNGIGLVDVGYKLRLDGNMAVNIHAKTASREETEKFIIKLENEPTFSKVNSPLSNLVGKGERFIQLGITLDKEWLNADPVETDEEVAEKSSDDTAETSLEEAGQAGDAAAEGEDDNPRPEDEPTEDQPEDNNPITQ